MSARRLPFWITTVSTLALGACIRQAEPVGQPVETPTVGLDETTGRDAGGGETRTREIADGDDGRIVATITPRESGLEDVVEAEESEPSTDPSPPARQTASHSTPRAEKSAADAPASEPMYYAPPTPPAGVTVSPQAYGATGVAGGVGYRPVSPKPTTTTALPPSDRIDLPVTDNTENYTDYGVSDFVIAQEDPLSTFAIDVDTASYTVTRRKLNEGYLPPQSAVRVEEFVNYFPYEYKQPKAGDPFAVDFEAAPSPWNPRNTIVRVGVQGKKVGMDDRQPAHLTFLVDVSGSMRSPDKIDLVKKSLTMLTEELEDGDTVAIATYAGSTDIVLEPTPISRKDDIVRSLDRLTAGGSTAMASGIDLAYRLADQTYIEGGINRVIICSDGDANVGQTSHEVLSKQIHQYAEKGITLTTLGFGNGNYQDTMMEQLANDGDGNYFYIDSEIEARRVLVDKMTSTLEVIAKDVKIQVDWDPGAVVAYRLIGYENRDVADVDFRNDKVDAGEIGAGHQVTAIYEVALKDDPSGRIATVRVRNKAPGPDAPATERSFALDASAIRSATDESSDQFRLAFAAATFAEILRGSPHVQEVTLRDVEALARGAQRPEYREDAELIELIGRAATLKGESPTYSSLH